MALSESWTHGLIALSVRASERHAVVVGSNVQIHLSSAFYSYFKESFGGEYHIYIYSIYGIRGQGLESYDNLCIPELGHDLPCPNWNPELGLESLYMAIYHKD